MYLLLIPLVAAILFDRIQKLRQSIKKNDREAILFELFNVGLIVLVLGILVLLIETKPV